MCVGTTYDLQMVEELEMFVDTAMDQQWKGYATNGRI